MGQTYKRERTKYDDEFTQKREGKSPRNANKQKLGGLKTLNKSVDYDDDIIESYYEHKIH